MTMTSYTLRRLSVFFLAGALLAGCSSSVNLILERRSFDRYQDRARQASARLAEDQAFLNEALEQTDDEDLAPYPALQDECDAMKRALALVAEDQARIDKFKEGFDAFAGDRPKISVKDPVDGPRFRALQSDFGALAQAADADFGQFDQAGQAYAALLQQYGIEKIRASDLQAQLNGQATAMHDSVRAMRERLASAEHALKEARRSHSDREVLGHKQAILGRMADSLPAMALLSDSLAVSAAQLSRSVHDKTVFWSGPGMAGDLGSLLVDWRAGQERFWKGKKDFEAQAVLFDKPEEPKHEKDEGRHDEGQHEDGEHKH